MIRMRSINWLVGICIFACGIIPLQSCSDENNENVSPSFPEVQKMSFTAGGEEQKLTFDAEAAWTLSSSRLWCKFVSGSEELPMVAGLAGENTVTVKVTDEIWNFEESTAELTLSINGVSQVIATIVRGAKTPVIDGYDDEHPVEIAYAMSQSGIQKTITVKANFDWALEQSPEWLAITELPLQGDANREYEIEMTVKDEYKVSAQEGVLAFTGRQGADSYSFPVKYAGMGEKDIEISLSNVWNWNVSREGDLYWSGSLSGDVGETEKENFPLNIKIAAKDYKYEVIRFVSGEYGLTVSAPEFMNEFFQVEDDKKGNLSVSSVDLNTGAARDGYILTIPESVYVNDMQEDPDMALSDDYMSIGEEYEKYVAWNFKQEAGESLSGGFTIKDALSYEEIPCKQGYSNPDIIAFIMSEFSVKESQIYSVDVTGNTPLVIDPLLDMEEWNPSEGMEKAVTAMDFSMGDVDTEDWGLGMNASGFTLNLTTDKSIIIGFKDSNQIYKKVLIISCE